MIYTKEILGKICTYLNFIDLFVVNKVCKLYNIYIIHDKEQYILYNMYKVINNVDYNSKSNYYKLLLTNYHRYIINLNIQLSFEYKRIDILLVKKHSSFNYELRLKKILYNIEITRGARYYMDKYSKYKDKEIYVSNKNRKIDDEIKKIKDMIYKDYNVHISKKYLENLRSKIKTLRSILNSKDNY